MVWRALLPCKLSASASDGNANVLRSLARLRWIVARSSAEVRGRGEKHLGFRIFGIEPEQRQLRKGGLDILPAAADLADQAAFAGEVGRGLVQDAPDDVEPVGPAVEGELRLG